MPRGPRIDYPGLLHHVMVRGIERKRIFNEKADYEEFLARLEQILKNSGAKVYAWALIPNHFHLLIRIGKKPLKTIMRRLLTGYALYYNRRHKRVGYLYQGRYKSIVCEEEPYLLELVRYIHLNPLRAGLVKTKEELDKYRWSGHSVALGNQKIKWQDTEEILSRFGATVSGARGKYREFVIDGIKQGKREDLAGGGLIRSLGGIGRVLLARHIKEKQLYDQRILGDGNFVESVLKEVESMEESVARINIDELIKRASKFYKVDRDKLINRKKQKGLGKVKAIIVNIGIDKLGISGSRIAQRLRLSKSAISKLNKMGEALVNKEKEFLKVALGK
jgi:putative transposase